MTWWLIIILGVSAYVAGWFGTALAITQIGTVRRGCVPGCTARTIPSSSYDRTISEDRMWRQGIRVHGAHQVGCNKPHFELVTAGDAAGYALFWPYLWFYGALALSEQKAHRRVEVKASREAKKQITPEQLKNLDKILENPNVVINADGSIKVIKELTDG